jgi:ribonuclease HI
LKAASLTPEEARDILSTTQNKLDFEAISQALSALWDEQLLGHW